MKRIIELGFCLLVFVLTSQEVYSQTLLKDANNHLVGYYQDDKFYDLNSVAVLDCSSAGEIRNVSGDVAATYNSVSGELRDANNELLYVLEGTSVKNTSGIVVGSVSAGGELKDINGDTIAEVSGIANYRLVYYYLVYSRI